MKPPVCRLCEKPHYGKCPVVRDQHDACKPKPTKVSKLTPVVLPGVSLIKELLPDVRLVEELLARIDSLESRVGELESRKKYMREYQRTRRSK